MKAKYDPATLKDLMAKAKLSISELAKATDIPCKKLEEYLSNSVLPPSNDLMVLAEYFAVPIDLLVGRYDEALAKKIMENYAENFMKIRRDSYEKYLIGHERAKITPYRGISRDVWPYNLLRAVFGDNKPLAIIDEKHEQDILDVVYTLDSRQRHIILAYYRDNKTRNQIADELHISYERVRQLVSKALRLLSAPHREVVLRYGKEIAEQQSYIFRKRLELAEKVEELEQEEEKLNEEKCNLFGLRIDCRKREKEIEDTINQNEAEFEALQKECSTNVIAYVAQKFNVSAELLLDWIHNHQGETGALYRTQINLLGLSNRAVHALHRHFGSQNVTLVDVVMIAKNGTLLDVRSLGIHLAKEILAKIEELTGEDLFFANKVNR